MGKNRAGVATGRNWPLPTDGLRGRYHRAGHPASSMSLVNVAYAPPLTWANPTLDSLEE
jgi:hypothetical protein